MTTEQYIASLDSVVQKTTEAFGKAVATAHESQSKRIFEMGGNSAGGKIGEYSTKTMLASKKQFIISDKFKQTITQGVNFASKVSFKNGKTVRGKTSARREKSLNKPLWLALPNRKTGKKNKAVPVMVIDGGYKAFRALNGRESAFVNLRFRGTLQTDFNTTIIKNSPIKYTTGVKNKHNADKIGWMEEKYGKIFDLTKAEKDEFYDILQKELANDLNNLRK